MGSQTKVTRRIAETAISGISAQIPTLALMNRKDVTSVPTPDYNCIAWALGVNDAWWWPDVMEVYYWPPHLPRVASPEVFSKLFEEHGYSPCSSGAFTPGVTKIALYTREGKVTHAARQLSNGKWTSKLGSDADISHGRTSDVECRLYGNVTSYFQAQSGKR